MKCPLCRTRSAKRYCPALRYEICAVCCGSKRGVEIACTTDCPYLASSRSHPPAMVRRQQERDVELLGPAMDGLTNTERQLVLLMMTAIGRSPTDPLQPTRDIDVADAAGALAGTLETAVKGVIYEHRATSVPAQRLVRDMQTLLDEVGKNQPTAFQAAAALALRRIEDLARRSGARGPGIGDRAGTDPGSASGEKRPFIELAERISRQFGAPNEGQERGSGGGDRGSGKEPSSLILP